MGMGAVGGTGGRGRGREKRGGGGERGRVRGGGEGCGMDSCGKVGRVRSGGVGEGEDRSTVGCGESVDPAVTAGVEEVEGAGAAATGEDVAVEGEFGEETRMSRAGVHVP